MMQNALRHSLPMWLLLGGLVFCAQAQNPGDSPQSKNQSGPNSGEPPPMGGPPPFGQGGLGGRGPGPMGWMQQERKVVKQFDLDGNKRLDVAERRAARESLAKERAEGGGRPGGFRFGGRRDASNPPSPGAKITPAEVKSFPDKPLYDPFTLRTLFLEFENTDWEQELSDFHGTDVEVPARLQVDGKTYSDVGVHFRGTSSYMMIEEGRKRSLNLSLDFALKNQNIGGYRTLNLLNSSGDPTFLRAVLFLQIAREYIPAPLANLVRVVINGESWGIYINVEQFNKDFIKEWFGTTKGARWKVPGSPGARGGLEYLGEDPAPYKRIYEIKTKDDPESWAAFIHLCKVLNQTPPDKLEEALSPLLNIDGVLKFMALDNALVNDDGYWTRASDYYIYLDEKGRFHIIPNDINETFSTPGGPGFGGPGFGGGPGGGPMGFGPGMIIAFQVMAQADKDSDRKLTKEEFASLADVWFDKLDPDKTGKLDREQFVAKTGDIMPPPTGFGPPGGSGQQNEPRPEGRGGGFGPAQFIGPSLFTAVDMNKDGSLTRAELKDVFSKWYNEWDKEKSGSLDDEKLRAGLAAAMPQPSFGGRGGRGGRGGDRGPGGPGFGGGPRTSGVELDPFVAINDTTKPLLSKLLAVPSLKNRYLGYIRDIADKWLDWNKLGPMAQQYHTLIAADVKADTRKLFSVDAFISGLTDGGTNSSSQGSGRSISLQSFASQRRAYLLGHAEVKKLAN